VLAAEHGLQCFDPQWNRLRPVATDVDVARRPSNGLTCSIDRKPNDLGLRTCRNVLDMQRCGRRCTDVPIRVGSWWATR
jgi:hypothetical protein